jgi:hypothetical protein
MIAASSLDSERFVGVSEALRLTAWGAARLYRFALIGQVKFQHVPGEPPRFRREDLVRLAGLGKADN